ncbi:hypothetical protein [Phaffia rhodozyma]|uniref:Uncharacterized protein n=1 Tax=Phaffia rhodozyma TaxID=264483 RepID=A0A0F7SU83_PHARH|nr:hypothetical protein [Phaffia rhodozyma]
MVSPLYLLVLGSLNSRYRMSRKTQREANLFGGQPLFDSFTFNPRERHVCSNTTRPFKHLLLVSSSPPSLRFACKRLTGCFGMTFTDPSSTSPSFAFITFFLVGFLKDK